MSAVIICASGPSLVKEDCRSALASGLPIIAVNSTWRAIPECAYIYAGDLCWWDACVDTLPAGPARWTCNRRAASRYNLNLFDTDTQTTFNSGMRAILFAASMGRRDIILLGYDCSIDGDSHWHGDHPTLDNPTAANVKRWYGEFELVAQRLRGKVNIINSSRQTALNCFRRLPLDAALREVTC